MNIYTILPTPEIVKILLFISLSSGNLNIISDAGVCHIISKGPKYRFSSKIDFLFPIMSYRDRCFIK